MYSLLSGLWRYWRQRDEYYVLILGLDAAGKTVGEKGPRLAVLSACPPPCLVAGSRMRSLPALVCAWPLSTPVSCLHIVPTKSLLEKFKSEHDPRYRGIPLTKITPTVGLNSGCCLLRGNGQQPLAR